MNILLLTLVVPNPPDSGPKIKTHYLLRHLAAHHRVTLVTFTRTEQEERDADALRPLCAAVHTVPMRRSRITDVLALARSLRNRRPWLIERDNSAPMRQFLSGLVQQEAAAGRPFHLVHADQLNMAQFAAPLGLPRLLDQHNAVWTIFARMMLNERGPKRLLLEREWRLLSRYEGQICAEFEAVTTVSYEDRRALQEAIGTARDMPVIPIAIDTEVQAVVPRETGAHGVLSMATMMWPPNVDGVLWFAREIYPLVRRAVPAAHFFVVGQRPVAEVCALPEGDPSIEVTGYVPATEPYIARSACLVVPLRSGGGMRVKILEALARGIPIVSTTIGYEGIDVTPGEHLLVADTPAAFANAVTQLLCDPQLGAQIAEAGRRRVVERYDWRNVCPMMDEVYERIAPAARHSTVVRSP